MRKRIYQLDPLGRPLGPGDYLVVDNQKDCESKRIPWDFFLPNCVRLSLRVTVKKCFNNRCCHASCLKMVLAATDIGRNVTFSPFGDIPCMLYLHTNSPTCGPQTFKANSSVPQWNLYGTLGIGDKFYFPFSTFAPTLHLAGVDYLPSEPWNNCCDCFYLKFRPLAAAFCLADAALTVNAVLTTCPNGVYVPYP